MYLSPHVSEEEGSYFTYPQSSTTRMDNMRTCLPGGFSGSGPEFATYKSNCLDLMAEQCSSEWTTVCDAYHSNLNKNEQDLFKQMIDRRNASSAYSTNGTCRRMLNTVVPGQKVLYGINPRVQGSDCTDNIVIPRSCPYNLSAPSEQPVQMKVQQREEPFPYPPDEMFQSELIHRKMHEEQQARRKKEHFQSELIQQQMYHNEQARAKEHFQSEMIQRGLYENRRMNVPIREQFQAEFIQQQMHQNNMLAQKHQEHFQSEMIQQQMHQKQEHFQAEMVQGVPVTFQQDAIDPEPFMPSMNQPMATQYPQPPPFLPDNEPMPSQFPEPPQPFVPVSQPLPSQFPEPPQPFVPVSQPMPSQFPEPPQPFVPVSEPMERRVRFEDSIDAPLAFGVPTDCEHTACSVSKLFENE